MASLTEPAGNAVSLPVSGMNCAACAGRVERALAAVPGVAEPRVNLATKRASFTVESAAAFPAAIEALQGAGYPAELYDSRLTITGMTCAGCAGKVERALAALPGVAAVHVNLATATATVRHAGLAPARLVEAVARAGYGAEPAEAGRSNAPDLAARAAKETAGLKRDLIVAAVLTLPIFVVEMGGHLYPPFHHYLYWLLPVEAVRIPQFILAALVLAFPGRRFFTIGIPALLRGGPEMNSLVALGAGAAFLYSTVATFAPDSLPDGGQHVYFEAAVVIVTLILFGRWLEARARGRAGEAIRRLVELAPDKAERVLPDGSTETVAVADLRPGDVLRLLPGARVAADGVVVEGRGAVDESMLTGEPIPVTKARGDAITGGTVNGSSVLAYRVQAVGADTALARIVEMVESAQAARLPVQDLVDRVTRIFVPAVIGLALLALAIWLAVGPEPRLSHALVAAISVLIIACPCAMGLAVPVSILVGTGRGAELGVLFRRGEALQRLAEARIVAFDKTGTLTEGAPALTSLAVVPGFERTEALRLAAGAEAHSEHPLAVAILAAAKAEGVAVPPASEAEALTGRGHKATVEGRAVLIGNRAALEESGVAVDAGLLAQAEAIARDGGTPVLLAVDGAAVAAIGLSDPIRADSTPAIRALHDLGLQTAMISGDSQATAEAVGRQLGIDQVRGNTRPEGKLEAIRAMGAGTVFVGDGINDAPALAAAETGIAIGTGTDVAIETADAVLMGDRPSAVADAVRLSRAVMRNIRQNLIWAFGYNILLIPVAMGVLVPFGGPQLSPMLGAGAMALSSVFVVGNALRLRRFR